MAEVCRHLFSNNKLPRTVRHLDLDEGINRTIGVLRRAIGALAIFVTVFWPYLAFAQGMNYWVRID